MPESDDKKAQLRVSWRGVAIAATILAICCLATLTIIAAVEDVNALATVALALAILAFVVQILVFLAQSWSSEQGRRHADAVRHETRILLAQMQEAQQGTQAALTSQYDKVLQAALQQTTADATETGIASPLDLEAFQRDLLRNVRELLGEARPIASESLTQDQERSILFTPDPSPESLARWAQTMTTFPGESSGLPAYRIFRRLSPAAKHRLETYGRKRLEKGVPPLHPGYFIRQAASAPDDELIAAGLLQEANPPFPSKNDRYATLTELGVEAARFATATGEPPDYVKDFPEKGFAG